MRLRRPTLINDPRYELKDARALGPGKSELHEKPPVEFEQGMATLERCVNAQPQDPIGFVVLARLFWDKAYRDPRLEDDEKLAYLERGLRCTDRALALKKDLFEALAYRGLLLRVKAKAVSDEALQKRLEAETDALRDQVQKFRSAGALPHPGLEPGQWPQLPARQLPLTHGPRGLRGRFWPSADSMK